LFTDINITKLIKNNKNTDTKTKKSIERKITDNDIEKVKVDTVPASVILLRHSGYYRIYATSIAMWKERPLTGFGLKSLRFKCWDMLVRDNVNRQFTKKEQIIVCSNHAHNYYLELLSEAGIIGVSLIIIFFLILLKNIFYYLKRNNQKINSEINLLIPIIILFILEIWPIKSTGSFFTTWGATFFWLNIGLLITGISKKT
jgi:O-antigen ligase